MMDLSDLTKWLSFEEAGVYAMRGSSFMEWFDPNSEAKSTTCEDFVWAEFTITISPPEAA